MVARAGSLHRTGPGWAAPRGRGKRLAGFRLRLSAREAVADSPEGRREALSPDFQPYLTGAWQRKIVP